MTVFLSFLIFNLFSNTFIFPSGHPRGGNNDSVLWLLTQRSAPEEGARCYPYIICWNPARWSSFSLYLLINKWLLYKPCVDLHQSNHTTLTLVTCVLGRPAPWEKSIREKMKIFYSILEEDKKLLKAIGSIETKWKNLNPNQVFGMLKDLYDKKGIVLVPLRFQRFELALMIKAIIGSSAGLLYDLILLVFRAS